MLPENAAIVRRVVDLYGCDPEAALKLIDAEGVMDWTASRAPYSGVYRGHAEIRRMWQVFLDAWEDWATEVLEAVELDPETVLLVTFVHGRGKGSGALVEAHGASLWSMRDGKVTRAKLFQNRSEALEAAGLPERGANVNTS